MTVRPATPPRAAGRTTRCAAAVKRPDVLLLDEPTSNLDPPAHHKLYAVLSDFTAYEEAVRGQREVAEKYVRDTGTSRSGSCAPLWVLLGLVKVELGDFQRHALRWAIPVSVACIGFASLTGAISVT
ncbi:hypothetical protein [Streptomyces sp. NPDC057877]|uniref:hypothetical protein n=1 Tax=Streptomyces sp. NPDC057877 TaxID=3346269 RepID=UPI0036BC701D